MRKYSEYFKLFLSVPLTKSGKGKVKSSKAFVIPSESAVDAAFNAHLKRMSQQGVYGDNLEICAFSREYNCNVKIYQREFAYVVSGGDWEGAGSEERKMVHIAYHTWEHYSSIRNLAGPHTGLPEVNPVLTTEEGGAVGGGGGGGGGGTAGKTGGKVGGKTGGKGKYALPWMVQTVMHSLPYLATEEEIEKCLEECKGNVNDAVGRLLDKTYGDESGDGGEGGGKDEESSKNENEPGVEADLQDGDSTTKEEVAEAETGLSLTPQVSSPPKELEGPPKTPKNHTPKTPHRKKKNAPLSTTSHTSPTSATSSKPKARRETARERKERQKAEAQARKKNKGVKGAADSSPNPGSKSSSKTGTVGGLEGGIRELYI